MPADSDDSTTPSRRLLLSSLALLGPAARASAQPATQPAVQPAPPPAAPGVLEQARESYQRNREALAKVQVARHVEPAFRFEA